MADDRNASNSELPPEAIAAALHDASVETFQSLYEIVDRLQDRATLAGVYVVTILFRDDGPGSCGYLFTRATNASDPIEEEMLSLAGRKLESVGFGIFRPSDDDDDDDRSGGSTAPTRPPDPGVARATFGGDS